MQSHETKIYMQSLGDKPSLSFASLCLGSSKSGLGGVGGI